MILLSSNKTTSLHTGIANQFGATIGNVETRQFPDKEIYLRIQEDLKDQNVLVVQNIRTERDFLELLFLLEAARSMEPSRIDLVFPYFQYARQHMRYNIGEPISSKVIVEAVSPYVDALYSIDIHNEETLEFSSKPFNNFEITDSIVKHYKEMDISFVVSPDDGGYNRAMRIGKALGSTAFHLDKKRENDSTVKVVMNDILDIYGRNILLIDDIISTGGTVLQSIELLKRRKVNKIYVCAVHGIFANRCDETISFSTSGLSVTNTIESIFSSIDVSEEISKKLKELIK